MAQFDLHTNVGRLRAEAPYLVVVQSRRFDASPTRLVIPLVVSSGPDSRLAPRFVIEERSLLLNPLQMFAIPAHQLGPRLGSLAADPDAGRIIGAIDEAISTALG